MGAKTMVSNQMLGGEAHREDERSFVAAVWNSSLHSRAQIQSSALKRAPKAGDDLSAAMAAECVVANYIRYNFVPFSAGGAVLSQGNGLFTDAFIFING